MRALVGVAVQKRLRRRWGCGEIRIVNTRCLIKIARSPPPRNPCWGHATHADCDGSARGGRLRGLHPRAARALELGSEPEAQGRRGASRVPHEGLFNSQHGLAAAGARRGLVLPVRRVPSGGMGCHGFARLRSALHDWHKRASVGKRPSLLPQRGRRSVLQRRWGCAPCCSARLYSAGACFPVSPIPRHMPLHHLPPHFVSRRGPVLRPLLAAGTGPAVRLSVDLVQLAR